MGKNYCAIKDCHNTKGIIGHFGIPVKLHHLPRDKDLRAAWIRAISRKDFKPSNYTQVCSDHFPGGRCKTWWCHKVPTLFLPQKMTPESKHRKSANSNKDRFWFSSLGIEDGNETMKVTNTDPGIFENDIHSYPKTTVLAKESTSELHISELMKDSRKEENLSSNCISNDQNRGRMSNDVLMVEEKYSPTSSDHVTITPYENTELSSHTSISESKQVCRPEITIEDIRDSTDQVLFYTGLVNHNTFLALYESLLKIGADRMDVENGTLMRKPSNRKLRLVDEFLMVLMRLRLGLLLNDLEFRFKLSAGRISRIFNSWITIMDQGLRSTVFMPPLATMQSKIPKCFKIFPDTRIILDCTELFIQTPSSLENKS